MEGAHLCPSSAEAMWEGLRRMKWPYHRRGRDELMRHRRDGGGTAAASGGRKPAAGCRGDADSPLRKGQWIG